MRHIYKRLLTAIMIATFFIGGCNKDETTKKDNDETVVLAKGIEKPELSSKVAEDETQEDLLEEKPQKPGDIVSAEIVSETIETEEEKIENKETKHKTSKKVVKSEITTEKKQNFNGSPTVNVIEYLLPLENSAERVEELTHIVIHFTSNAQNKPADPFLIEDTYSIFKDYGVSVHYVIGKNGEIYSLVKENRIAYHAGKGDLDGFPQYQDRLNHHSIGIELLAIGTEDEMEAMVPQDTYAQIDSEDIGYTEAQYTALRSLVDDIVKRHPSIQRDRNHIVGHDEYSKGRKTDPGSLFNWFEIGL
ncbi:N-acetylmuramoyl-L-alanine amidase [Lacticigenium naphthae]|uniref:N-acetylmuramoyl-L-alanine amidase n=1 Tax=Lacticigenium naphthae TaxID=515351 RepID=UPI00042566C7|nr:N-acetylmuramoyl-L-alanine amidase [Lacticigenium naphthae]